MRDRHAGVAEPLRNELRIPPLRAGARGVAFLALLDRDIDIVVDINPRKQGTFTPGSGFEVRSPDSLASDPPELVFILNPMYRAEIAAALADMAIRSEVILV